MAFSLKMILRTKWRRTFLLVAIATLLITMFIADQQWPFANLFSIEGARSRNDRAILTPERFCFEHVLGGRVFSEKGGRSEVSGNVTSCLIHSFSPYVEREAARRFVDPAHDNVFYANSPAVRWHKDRLVLVTRIWLERERYEAKQNWPANHFADNWLYTQTFDAHMRPTSPGAIMGIPNPKQWWVGDGPIEPRLFSLDDRLFVTFNAAMAFAHNAHMDFTVMWDYERNSVIIPKIRGGSPMINATEPNDMPRDKHWAAFIDNGKLFFVHNLDPLRIMHCTLDGSCEFVHNESDRRGFIFNHRVSHLRGGTPFEQYDGQYYIGVAHATMYKNSNHHRFYTAHIVVIHARPYRVVFVSNHIQIDDKIYRSVPIVRSRYIDDGFIFPVGFILESRDSFVLGVHISDFSSVLLRVRNIRALMDDVMAVDRRRPPRTGPPVGCLHKFVHDAVEGVTHIQLED